MTNLRDPFAVVHQKPKRNKDGSQTLLDYVSWSQVADRLDEAVPEWSFVIVQLGEDWAWGRLTLGGRTFENVGYAENADAAWKSEVLKDAVSDALKRCAAMAGVGRYLYDRDAPRTAPAAPERPVAPVPPPARPATPLAAETAPHGGWAEGQVHVEGHKPLRARQNGSLYCPTKLANGTWCNWKHDAPTAALPLDEPPAPDWEGLM
jgi:hypothetical protein